MLDDLKNVGYDTSIVNENAEKLLSCANNFESVIATLSYIRNQIKTNWDGTTEDIAGVLQRIDRTSSQCTQKIIPAMRKLGNGWLAFSAAIDEVSKSTIESGSGSGAGSYTREQS